MPVVIQARGDGPLGQGNGEIDEQKWRKLGFCWSDTVFVVLCMPCLFCLILENKDLKNAYKTKLKICISHNSGYQIWGTSRKDEEWYLPRQWKGDPRTVIFRVLREAEPGNLFQLFHSLPSQPVFTLSFPCVKDWAFATVVTHWTMRPLTDTSLVVPDLPTSYRKNLKLGASLCYLPTLKSMGSWRQLQRVLPKADTLLIATQKPLSNISSSP